MPSNIAPSLTAAAGDAARETGLAVISAEPAADFNGHATALFELALAPDAAPAQRVRLELSDGIDFDRPGLRAALIEHLREEAKRLRNPRPDAYVTLAGLPIAMSEFRWPFHRSTSGGDSYIVHGTLLLADGTASGLHVKVAASMTVTFAETILAPEQPYSETFIYNAIRKTLDQGQLELLKSGNRQPVPVTTRYYSRWQKKFFFTETNDESRRQFLLAKAYWLSGVLGEGQPIWIADPRDAQYLNTSADAFLALAAELAQAGLLAQPGDPEFASATPALMEHGAEYQQRMQKALAFTKPAFNEEMRAGHTNM